jgi:AraC family transcriptional regulator
MKYRIEDKGPMRLVGCKFFVSLENGLNYSTIPGLWDDLARETFEELNSLSDSRPYGVLGVFGEKHDNGFDYWMAASTTKPCPPHYQTVNIPAAKWAIFEGKGALPGSIQNIFKRLYTEWFPNSEYERRWDIFELEWFSDGDAESDDYICEGWVPVVKKSAGGP